jgi:hypothetical protein
MKQNPKHIQAHKDGKTPLEYLVTSMLPLDAKVHKHGADKYGVRNWRIDEITASTYEGAMMRHLFAWISGEDTDPDSGMPHLTHLRACCAVVLDAQMHGKLIDDRGRAESKSVVNAAAARQAQADEVYPPGTFGEATTQGYPGSLRTADGMPAAPGPRELGGAPGALVDKR